jgi:microcystin-dependent protein
MAQPYLGQIEAFPYSFIPRNWLPCQGQLLPVNQYQALFALLGTTYGGNGTTNFALPDLRGKVAMGQGSGSGLTTRVIGQQLGEVTHTLLTTEMPTHTHLLNALPTTTNNINTPGPTTVLASATSTVGSVTAAMNLYTPQSAGGAVALAATALTNSGGSQPHSNMMPYLTLQFCISMSGFFPSRN